MSIEDIYKKLGYEAKGGFVPLDDVDWPSKVKMSTRVVTLIQDTLKPLYRMTALFAFGGKPLMFFFDNPQNEKDLFKIIWNLNEVPIIIIDSDDHVDVFNGFAYEKELETLELIGNDSVLDQFTYFKLVTGEGWEEYRSRLEYHNRVDYRLLKNIEYAQLWILKTGVSRNLANRLIGKMIFLRYLTDRHVVLNFEGKRRALNNDDLIELLQNKERLCELFETLQDKEKGFNGDLFKINKVELDAVPEAALYVLVRLLRSDNLEDGTRSLFDVYDFSILPIEFISNVYERFIGKENQEKEGAYYTPLFLVDYIVERTVACHLETSSDDSCRVLDPACGSGVFLVETLRCIIDHYIAHANKEDSQGTKFQDKLRELVLNNIFGIDSDQSAIQVAAFSIYLTMLDYQKPADISTFRFPNLLETNLICQDAFKPVTFSAQEFDYIIGNPPWKRGGKDYNEAGEEVEPEYLRYIDRRAILERRKSIIGNKEIAQAFVVRTLDFMSEHTKTALVLTSKVLYNGQSLPFRRYFLEKAQIDSVLELSSVRHEVFSQSSDPSVAPACVLSYKRKLSSTPKTNNLVTHTAVKPSVFFTLFKVMTVEKADIQQIRQDLLYQYDYVWKILLYGTYMDFLFVKRLKDMRTILQEINDRRYQHGVGVTVGRVGTRHDDISDYVGKKKTEASHIKQYVITPSNETWHEPKAHRGREKSLFKAPLLLMRKGLDTTDYSCRAALCKEDSIYTGTITGIHGDDVNVLRNIAGVLNSRLFSYYALMCLSSIGTEREQGFKIEKFSLPYLSGSISMSVEKIEKMYESLEDNPLQNKDDFRFQINKLKAKIEDSIIEELNMTSEEQSLMDYAMKYSIPLATERTIVQPLKNDRKGKKLIADYADVFLRRFDGQFGNGMHLNCSCLISGTHLLLRFKVEKEGKPLEYKQGTYSVLEAFLLAVSSEQLTDQLFLRKDIRGFERDGFYLIKPCEQRLWHPAVAYVDVQEFVDALLTKKG